MAKTFKFESLPKARLGRSLPAKNSEFGLMI